jgi:hypothetical protein
VPLLVVFCWLFLCSGDFEVRGGTNRLLLPRHRLRCASFPNVSSPNSELSAADLAEVKRPNLVIANRGGDVRGLAFDRLADYLNTFTVRYYFREVNGIIEPAEPRHSQNLGGIFPIKPGDAIRAVETSDIVFLSDERLKRGQSPFDQSIIQCWQVIDGNARSRMELVAAGKIDDITCRIFAPPAQ